MPMKLTFSAGTMSVSKTLSDADATRLLNFAKAQYPNEDGSVPTNIQAFNRMVSAIFEGLKNNIISHEKAEAAKNADSGVSDITLT